MATEIKMPQLGESVVEGTITKWLKQEGDSVDEDELLVEVSTDKVDSEVPSSASGTVQKILVGEGETVKVGTAIAVVGEGAAESDGEAQGAEDSEDAEPSEKSEAEEEESEAEEPANDSGEEQPAAEASEAEPSEGDVGKQSEEADAEQDTVEDEGKDTAEAQAEPATKEKEPSAQRAVSATDGGDTSKRGVISPLVRRLADEHNLDLSRIEGTGTGGRIRKQDVLAFLEKGEDEQAAPAAAAEPEPEEQKAARPQPAAAEREELVAWTNIRKRTAEHMVASVRETARAWNAVEVDWTPLVAMRERVKANFKQREGFNLTYMGFLGRALCETLLEMPEVNSTYDEENQANRLKHYVNLGVAVALEGGGLIVPVVKGADEKNLVGLARAINEIVMRARAKKLAPDDLQGGSFTITNPGPFGSVVSVPIIPRGQAAILSFEAIGKKVVVTDDDSIAIRSTGFLTLSWDHRVIDGAEASRFLALLKKRLETMDFSSELAHYL
jgi:2-oxoglutarate dehydrogenase E2 component (dihydrolipoamide succinyltransferase)